jgi:hypothetical protein
MRDAVKNSSMWEWDAISRFGIKMLEIYHGRNSSKTPPGF